MNITAKKMLTAMLLAALTLALLASCDATGKNSGGNADETAGPSHADPDDSGAETRPYPDLEAVDFGGYEFAFASRTWTIDYSGSGWADWDHRDLFAERENGETINDAVYKRNKKIEEKYNIKINEIVLPISSFSQKISQVVKADDDAYDAICAHLISEFANFAYNGYIIDLFRAPNLDLRQPWWNQGCVEDLSISHKLFVAQGDLLIMDNDAMEAMIFNKTILQDQALESPYEIVKRGEWTFDKLTEMAKAASKDLNGDGKMEAADDLFGVLLQADTDISFLVSGGEKICAKDKNDLPVITFGSDSCYRILEAVSELMLDEDNVINLHRLGETDELNQVTIMEDNRALFSWLRMRIVERLRGMEMDFGILPCPKLDKAQKKYITQNNPHTGVGISIPVVASDLERTGMILEDLCAESRYTLQPAYYEVNLRGKFVRDDESQEMLDIILSNTAYDIGYIYDFGGFASTILYFGRDKRTDYASTFEKMAEKMRIDIDKTIAEYEKLD